MFTLIDKNSGLREVIWGVISVQDSPFHWLGWLKGLVGLRNAKDTFQLICLWFIKRGWYDLKQQGFPCSFHILLIVESGKDQLTLAVSNNRPKSPNY